MTDLPMPELAALLARGFIRSLAARCQGPEIAPNPGTGESRTASPNCLDVPAQQSDELVTRQRVGRP